MKKNIIIIAEAGVNHNGKLSIAKKLIDGASDAGADYVKFQLFKAKDLVSIGTNKAEYQKKGTKKSIDQFEMLKKLELSELSHIRLKKYAHKKNIGFLTSAFDINGLYFIKKLKTDYIKIPSGEITNVPYLKEVGLINKLTILSTGMSTFNEIDFAIKTLLKSGLSRKKLTVMQCNTEYPSPIEESNINAMVSMKNKLKVSVGYSDHTLGFESAMAATALGAEIIEKHITTNRKLIGPDHFASVEINDFKLMVNMIRNTKLALGSYKKMPSYQEKKNIMVSRKKILTSRNIKKNEIFTKKNIIALRSNNGISSVYWDQIIGKKASKDYKSNEPIFFKK